MIEPTLSYLGKFLGERSGLGNKKIVFHEKEQIFTFLKDNSLPRELPIISYYMSTVTDPMEMRSQHRVKGDYNKNFTTVEAATIVPVKIDITIALVSNKLTDYFSLLNFYFSINNLPKFTVVVDSDEVRGEFEASITELNSLSTPSAGEEGKDYDKGKYYVMEGSFSISTYLVYVTEEKVVRRIGFDTDLTPPINIFNR
jgi:hypothetical protein